MLKIKKEILEEMDALTILNKASLFLSDYSLNFPFTAYYTKQDASFGNLNYNIDNLTDNEKNKLELYRLIEKKKGLNSVTFLNKKELIFLFNDVLVMNGMDTLDVNKILLEEENLQKDKTTFQENDEKITETKKIIYNDEKDFELYLLKRGIDPNKHFYISSLFKKIETTNSYNEKQNYYGIECVYRNSFDGYKLPFIEKAKIGFNSPTIINNNSKILYVSEGKFDLFEKYKNQKNIDLLINNGINYSKFYFETLQDKKYEKIKFLIDKDIPGIIFFMETIAKLNAKNEEINTFIEKQFILLNKKLLTILKDFSETEDFINFYETIKKVKKYNPIKRKSAVEEVKLLSLIDGNQFFEKYDTTRGFNIEIEENNKVIDTYHLILLFNEIFKLDKNFFLNSEIIKNHLDNLKPYLNNIDFEISEKTKDFNDETQIKISILDFYIQNENVKKQDIYIRNNINYKYNFNLSFEINREEFKNLKNDNINDYYKKINLLFEKIKIFDIEYINNIQYNIDIEKINSIELENNSNEKELDKTIENDYNVYGIDEAGMGTSIGPLFTTIVYANQEDIKNYLLNELNNLDFRNTIDNFNSYERKILNNLEEKILNNEIEDFKQNFEKILKKNIFNNLNSIKPLYNLYCYSLINDSKKIDNEDILKLKDFIKELSDMSLIKFNLSISNVQYHDKIKDIQKKEFKNLISIPEKIGEDNKNKLIRNKEKLENIEILSIKNKIVLNLINNFLSKDKLIIIDGIDVLNKDYNREDIKIHFEPKADSKYFQVSLASIVSKSEQISFIKNLCLEIEKISDKIVNKETKDLITKFKNEINNNNGYFTERHKKVLIEICENKNIPEDLINLIKENYRINKATEPLLSNLKIQNLKNNKSFDINI